MEDPKLEENGQTLLYVHIHMAKTAGSFVNGALALKYERVCGKKGYSYDAYQANLRYSRNLSGDLDVEFRVFLQQGP